MKKTICRTIIITVLMLASFRIVLVPAALLAQEEDLTFETVTKMVVVLTEQVVALTEEFTGLQKRVDVTDKRYTDLEQRVDAIDELLPETPVKLKFDMGGHYCPIATPGLVDSYALHLYKEKCPGQNLPKEYKITNILQHQFLGITTVRTEASWYRDGSSRRRIRFLMEYWADCKLLGAMWED